MDTHQLKVFLAVYKHKNFSYASVKLGLKQPTVSVHIKSLEKQLGCRLFDRTGQKVIPTLEARVLFEHAEAIVEMMAKLESTMKCSEKTISGEIVFGASTIPAAYILPSAAASFRATYPAATFKFFAADSKIIAGMVTDHELLAGIVGARIAIPGLEYKPIIGDELIVVGHPSLLKNKVITLRNIKALPFILREEGSGTRAVMEAHFRHAGLDMQSLNVTATLGSTDAVKQAVKSGLGVSVISRIAVVGELQRKELVAAKIKGLAMGRCFCLVTHKGRTIPRSYKAFIEHLSNPK